MAEQIGIRIGLQGVQQVTSGLQQVQGGLGGLVSQAKSAGAVLAQFAPQLAAAFTVGAFTNFIRSTAQAIDGMNDLADATGASIEEISKLDVIVRRNGGSFDTAAAALVKFNQVLSSARPGSEAAESLRAIGLEAEALRRLDPAVALRQTAVALAGFADNADKARLVQELFGRSVREVAPLLRDLAEAGDVSAGVTAEQAEEVDKLNKQLAGLRANFTDLGRSVALEVAPLVATIADAFRDGSDTSNQLATDLSAVRVPLQAITILASDVGFVFKGVGREIGAIAAQLGALARADLEGFKAISEAVKADAAEARRALDEFQARVLNPNLRTSRPEPLDFGPRGTLPEIKLPPAADANAVRRIDAARQAYTRLTQSIAATIRVQEEEIALGGPLSQARRIQIDGYAKLSDVAAQLTLQQRLQIRGQIEAQAANATTLEQQDAEARILARLSDARDRYLETLTQSLDASRSAADAAAEELVGLVAGAQALEELRTARLEDAAAELQRKAAIESGGPDGNSDAAALYRAEAEELLRLAAIRRRIATANADQEVQAANDRAAKETADAWLRVSDQISQSLTDAIIEGGVSGREALERAFKSLVLRPIIQAAIDPLARQITGVLGVPGAPGGTGAPGQPNAIGSFLSSETGRTLTSALSYADAFMSAKSGNWGEAIGTAAGQYLGGPAGAAIGKVIGQAADKLLRGGAGTPSVGSVVTADASGARTGGADPSGILRNLNQETDQALRLLAGQSIGILNTLSAATGSAAQFSALAKFTADGRDASFGDFTLSRDGRTVADIAGDQPDGARSFASDPRAGFEAFAGDVAAITRQALADIDLPGFARKQIEALGADATLDDLAQVSQQIQATITAIGALRDNLEPLAGSLSQLAGASSDSLQRLAELSGGFESLGGNISTFYSAFVSEADRAAAETTRISDALGKFGLQLPQTREEFAALVQAQIALGSAGQPALAALLGVAGSFDQLTTRAEQLDQQLSDALIGAAEQFLPADQVLRLRTDRIRLDLAGAGVQVELQALLGASVDDIRAFATAFVTTGNASTEAQIAVLNAATALAGLRDTATGADQVLSQREQFERRILELQGNTAEIQRRDLLAVQDDYNRGLLQQIFALEKASGALQEFAIGADGLARLRVGGTEVAAGDFFSARAGLTSADIGRFVGLFPQGSADRSFLDANLAAGSGAFAGALSNEIAARLVAGNSLPFVSAGSAVTSAAPDTTNADAALIDALGANADAVRRLTGTLADYVDELTIGTESGLSPEQQFAAAQAQFRDTLSAARGGNTSALERLQADAQRAIQANEAAFGRGAEGSANFAEILRALQALTGVAARQLEVQEGSVQVTSRGLASVESAARGTTNAVSQRSAAETLAAQRLVGFDA
jgi:hypothetical protein